MKLILSRRAIIIASLFVALTERVPAQSAWDLYRITDGVTRTETAFHPVSVPIGREVVLADLKGPGNYISLAFWYREGTQKVAALPAFKEHTAGSFSDGQ